MSLVHVHKNRLDQKQNTFLLFIPLIVFTGIIFLYLILVGVKSGELTGTETSNNSSGQNLTIYNY